ncbi:LamG-like jellyroll fold domain-containing protein [Pontibacter sp. H249]|uniref:LamG-like jellyroll fold domain-containing protein n=1 Tax=Pontibacter sp. H249 TaxID=3133420 RepID=UPI0030BCD4DE
MKKLTLLIIMYLSVVNVFAQAGFTSITKLNAVAVSTDTGEKPQAKVWAYAGKHWAILPNSSGTYLWRLDGNTWTSILRLSTKTSSKADCKVVGNTVHIVLFQGPSSELVSVEYSTSSGMYELWSRRTSTVGLSLKSGTEAATIDIDGSGRMWLAYDGTSDINVRWSDSPYTTWSSPIVLASNVKDDDICAITAMPGKIGVLWSNQNSKRFGFKVHTDGAAPSSWSSDEVPASQSALNVGKGMADDHINLAVGSDGTLYAAVKTSYDNDRYPEIGLLVRRPMGSWDKLHLVSYEGTRPIVLLNEASNKVRVIYTSNNGGGDIEYNESSVPNISFSSSMRLISGSYDNATSIKDNFTSEVVILASSSSQAVGVLARDGAPAPVPVLSAPLLSSPANQSSEISTTPILMWAATQGATNYQVQVSTSSNFTSTVYNQSGITSTSASVSGLVAGTTYYWRVRAINGSAQSDWSNVWSFTTAAPVMATAPELASPANQATGVSASPTLTWSAAQGATSYQAQVSTNSSFTSTVYNQSSITSTSVAVTGLAAGTTYYWRVRGINATSQSNWSTIWSFTTTASTPPVASAPALTSPLNQATNVSTSPILAWAASQGADSYQAQVSTSLGFSSTVFDQSGISTTYASVNGLNEGTTYYWRIRATNTGGTSSWSAIWSFTTTTPTPTPEGNLVAYWQMDESGGTTLVDASTYENTATTVNNPSRVAGVKGQALRFNGTSQYATVDDNASLDITGAITIAAWIKPEQTATQYIVKKAEQKAQDGYELSLASNGKVFFRINQDSYRDTYRLNSNALYPNNGNTWLHVAITYDGTTMRMYINGIQNSSKSFSSAPPINSNNLPLTLGAGFDGYRGLKGAMDEVQIYNRALSGDEINQMASGAALASTSIASEVLAVPQAEEAELELLAYPNPFNSVATISFSLLEEGNYLVVVYDSKGAVVKELTQGRAGAGEEVNVELNGQELAKGLYLVRLQYGAGKSKTVRLLLQK